MKDGKKTINELIKELAELRQQITELKTSESQQTKYLEEISSLKKQLEFILGATKTGLDIIDSKYNIRYIDPEWEKVYGSPAGKKCFEYFMDENKICQACGIERALKTKSTIVTEELLVKENNRPIQVVTIPFQDNTGEWLVAEVNIDISERKKVEDALKETKNVLEVRVAERTAELTNSNEHLQHEVAERKLAEKRLRKLNECFLDFDLDPFDNINRLVSLCGDLMGASCALYNRLYKGMLCSWGQWNVPSDYNAQDKPEGHICYDVIRAGKNEVTYIPNLPESHYAQTDSNVKQYNLKTYIGKAVKVGNEAFGSLCVVYQGNFVPTEDDKNLISGIASAIGVEEKRRQAEEALRVSEGKYRDLYDNAPDMYHTLDKDGIIIDCNETEAAMLGYKKEEIIGRHLTVFFTEKSKDFFKKDFPKLNREKRQLDLEREFVKKDGSVFYANLNVTSEFDEKGKLLRTKTIARDITERKKLEEELLKVEKLESLGILAGGIAHDFNNILTTIMGNISLALMYLKPEEQNFQLLIDAEKASLRARDLTQQLLTFSRGGAPIRKSTSIKELIRESAGFALRGSNVRCEINIPEDIWPVKIDEGQISQVIHNLVINADQAMPEGGVIDISVVNTSIADNNQLQLPEGKYVKTTIKDNGVGIPEGYLNKIFDPYFTTKHKGSGLGLAISFSIIKKHEGYIVVESGLKSGTSFHIYLPASEEQTLTSMKEVQDTVKGKGRILVMDDDESIREVLGCMLQKIGYGAGFAKDGNETIELYRKTAKSGKQYDAVIIDLTIPGGMGGKETIQKLRQIDPDVRAIVSSGYSNDPVMAEFEKYGFKDVIAKPYKISQLSKVLHKVLTRQS